MSDVNAANITATGTAIIGLNLTSQSVNAPAQIAAGTLAAVGPITGQSVSVPGSVVAGSLAAVGPITGQSLSVPGNVGSGTLNVALNASIGTNLVVGGNLTVNNGVIVNGNRLIANNGATVNGNLDVSGNTTFRGSVNGPLDLSGNLVVRGTTTLVGALASNIDLSGNLVVRGTTTLVGALASNIDLSGNLVVRGTTTLVGALASNIDLSGNALVRGNVVVDTSGQLTRNNLLASTYNYVEAGPTHISDDYVMKTLPTITNFPVASTTTSWPSNPANVGSSTNYSFTSSTIPGAFSFTGPYYDKQKNNIYTESSIESACECISENSVMRAGMIGTSKDRAARRNRGQIISENKDAYIRNNVNIAPGSQTKLTSGFDGGQYFSDAPFGKYLAAVDDNVISEFKTQVFDAAGPVTRQLIPAPYRPFTTNENTNTQTNGSNIAGASKNVFFCINDGMGYNQVHAAKVMADMINQYRPFYLQDISGNVSRANYMGSGVDNFKLVWETSGNFDVVYRYTPTCSEMFRANDLPYLGVNVNRSKLTDPSGGLFINAPGINLVPDSAAISSAFSSGRSTGNEVINSVNDSDLGAQQFVYGNNVTPSDTGNATGLVYFKTFHEEAKAVGKLTVVSATSNVLHATPAGFVSRSTSRNTYTALIRNCFGPLGTQINLLMGAYPLSGSDRMPSSQLDTSSNAIMTAYFGGFRTYNFPEILSDVSGQYFDSFSGRPIPAWQPSEYKLYTTGGATYAIASVAQYARHYGWLICDSPALQQQFISGSVMSNAYGPVQTGRLTLNSKVFFATLGPSTAAFMGSNNSADAGAGSLVDCITNTFTGVGIAKVSSRIVPTATWGNLTPNGYAALTQCVSMSQSDLINNGKTILVNSGIYDSSNTFVWMHENSETDWAGHLGTLGTAAFETLESSYAQRAIYTDSSFVAITNIVQGCDHECGGWSFADLSGNIDYTDEVLADPARSESFYNAMNAFKAENNVHLATAFFSVDLTIPLNGTTNFTWDGTSSSYKFDPSGWLYNLTDTSYNPLSTASAISYTDTSNCDLVFDAAVAVMRRYLASTDTSGTNPLVAQFLPCALGISSSPFNLTRVTNVALISDLGAVDGAVYFDTSGQTQSLPTTPYWLNVRLPVSVLSRGLAWYKNNINISFTNYDNVIANVMYSAYNKARLYHQTGYGFLNDSVVDQRYNAVKFITNGGTAPASIGFNGIPDMQFQRLTAYPYSALTRTSIGVARRCVSHAQPIAKKFFAPSNKYFDALFSQGYPLQTSYYNHSNSVCRFWQKAPTLSRTFTELGITTAWPGVAGATTPAQWLYNNPSVPRTLSSTSVRQVLDMSI